MPAFSQQTPQTDSANNPPNTAHSASWYRWGLLLLFVISLILRFWGLERFNTLVFDEVYYAKFANNYLTQTPFFDGHPPLSKYFIAIAMWLGNQWPIGQDVANDLVGSLRTTWSYRWLNALTGAFIPIVVATLVQQASLTSSSDSHQNHRFALLAGILSGLDGLFLVESRYALNNVYLIIFGLLGQIFLLMAARSSRWRFWVYLGLSGTCFAASISIKWNGLWFLLAAFACLGLAWAWRLQQGWRNLNNNPAENLIAENAPTENQAETDLQDRNSSHVIRNLAYIHPISALLGLVILPFFVYVAIWIPHLQLNVKDTFWGLQKQILIYHQGVKAGKDVHPYCSTWDSWLLMQRPVAYFYKIGIDPKQVIPLNAPQLATPPGAPIYDVHAMGNPILWWASTAAIGTLLLTTLAQLWQWTLQWMLPSEKLYPMMGQSEFWVSSFVLINYAANLLPWTSVTRCIFLYHYMGSSIFAGIALAWWCDRAWQDPNWRILVQALLALIIAGFIFWLPIYLGLPLSPEDYKLRMWFTSWI